MDTITLILLLLCAVVASGMLVRMIPRPVPLPLIQIALGAAIAWVSPYTITLNPEVFFLLFLPPLLFLDGWRIPKDGLLRDRAAIGQLAFGLVLFTVLGVGLFIHWMIRSVPLPVAFALAAVLSPTDPIAVSAIAAKVPVPPRLMHILEGEALLNDASGLVCMRFAVATALTGAFSLTTAAETLLWLVIAGSAIGFATTWLVVRAKNLLTRRFGEESGSQVLISLLIPFAAYLFAEAVHASGILAAVAAGITMSYLEQAGTALAVTRIRRAEVWETLQFAANGVIFVLLGEQLPRIAAGAESVRDGLGRHATLKLTLYVIAVTAALSILRFLWVWASLHLQLFRAAREGRQFTTPSWRLIAASSVAGVRGAVTLAGVLTLPETLNNGTPFPARDLAIFLAAAVIIVSLIAASLALPRLLTGLTLPPDSAREEETRAARLAAAQAAIQAIEQTAHEISEGQPDPDLYAETASRLMGIYRQRLGAGKSAESAARARRTDEIERRLRLAALRAERDEFYRRARARELSDETARALVREIDLVESRYRPALG